MGDVIQPIAMQRLLASVAPTQCFWYAHPWNEDSVRGFRIGEFFGGDTSRLIHLTSDHADQVAPHGATLRCWAIYSRTDLSWACMYVIQQRSI